MGDPEMDIHEVFKSQGPGIITPGREARKAIGDPILMEMDAEAERSNELMLGLFHELKVGRVMDDSRHVGFRKLDTALFSVFRWHGIKLQHHHDLCEREREPKLLRERICGIMSGSGNSPWFREPSAPN